MIRARKCPRCLSHARASPTLCFDLVILTLPLLLAPHRARDPRRQSPLLHISVARDSYVPARTTEPAATATASGSQAAILARLSPAPGDEVLFMHSENAGGRLHRTIRLPRAGLLQLDRISCKLSDGLLTITVPRMQASELGDERKTVRIA